MPSARVERLMDRYYPRNDDAERCNDGTIPFYRWFLSGVSDTVGSVLNLGAGPTPEPGRRLRGRVNHIIGIDPDPRVMDNADLDEARLFDGVHIPFAADSFDAVFCDWTLEHVQRPLDLAREVRRVLKPGASFWFRTPNLYHYSYLASRFTPAWLHRRIANAVQAVPLDGPRYPTYYRMNTAPTVRRVAKAAGFAVCEIRHLESYPAYLVFNPVAFRCGVAYERLVNSRTGLAQLRAILLGRAQK